ncbi:polyphosphate polymerase domain-containing protein [Clostridium grantii]|uniref:polyphosphate polymerase domain-containing protein n=1 Tax=Clostridium grantii TaxID=40575 RepID=UPI001FA92CF6|nr:polyphosphate polymerase domain-containing protein [Clostridium grantii]
MTKSINLRHEHKYLLPYGNYIQIRNILYKIMKLDKHTLNNEGYHVRSVYFDDLYNTSLKEKLAGIKVRKKYRIRTYNFSSETIKLEIKEKYGDYTNKRSNNISKEEYKKIIHKDIDFLLTSNSEIKKEYYIEMKNNLLKPKVVVDYYREAYILPYNNIRITFDKNLSVANAFENIFSSNLKTNELPKEYSLIMEVKYDNFLPSHIKSVLEMFSLNKLSVSKYLLCREQLT